MNSIFENILYQTQYRYPSFVLGICDLYCNTTQSCPLGNSERVSWCHVKNWFFPVHVLKLLPLSL